MWAPHTNIDLANSQGTQSLGKNGCRQMCLDKSLHTRQNNSCFQNICSIKIAFQAKIPYQGVKELETIQTPILWKNTAQFVKAARNVA